MAPVVLAVDIGGTKMAAALVDGDGAILVAGPRCPPRRPTTPRRCSTRWPRWSSGAGDDGGGRRSSAASAAAARCCPVARRCRRSTSPRGAGFPLRDRLAEACRAAGRRRQRRQGAGARRGLAGGGPGRRQLSGHGGVDRHRWRHRARRSTARRRPGECRAHRSCGGRAGRAGLCLRRTGMPRGRGVRARRSRPMTGRPASEAPEACAGAPARWSAGRWPRWPICWTCELAVVAGSVALGFGPVVLRGRPRGDRAAGPTRLLPGDPDHPGGAGGRRPAGGCGGRGSPGAGLRGRGTAAVTAQ